MAQDFPAPAIRVAAASVLERPRTVQGQGPVAERPSTSRYRSYNFDRDLHLSFYARGFRQPRAWKFATRSLPSLDTQDEHRPYAKPAA